MCKYKINKCKPVSRILYPRLSYARLLSFILSGCHQPDRSTYPFTARPSRIERATLFLKGKRNLFGLSTRKVYHASDVTTGSGGLLPRLFTLTPISSQGGIFSVALSVLPIVTRETFPLGSTALFVVRTFLPDRNAEAIRRLALFYC